MAATSAWVIVAPTSGAGGLGAAGGGGSIGAGAESGCRGDGFSQVGS